MNGYEVNGVRDVAIAQPEFPDIGIGHRHVHPRLDRPDRVGEVGCGHIAAQQDLITNHNRTDGAWVFVGERDRCLDLVVALFQAARQPQALHNLQTVFGGYARYLVEAEIHRVGPYAVRHRTQARQIVLDLGRGNHGRRIQRRLGASERCVGHAIELFASTQLGRHK